MGSVPSWITRESPDNNSNSNNNNNSNSKNNNNNSNNKNNNNSNTTTAAAAAAAAADVTVEGTLWVDDRFRPLYLDRDDWVSLGSILSRAGIVDLNAIEHENMAENIGEDAAFSGRWHAEEDDDDDDEDGRIAKLFINPFGWNDDENETESETDRGGSSPRNAYRTPFHLSADVANLKGLTVLGLWNCGSIDPEGLSGLPSLRKLHLDNYRCPELLSNFPTSVKLEHLTELLVDFNETEPPGPFLEWMTNAAMLPNLTELELVHLHQQHFPLVFRALCGASDRFRSGLGSLSVLDSVLPTEQFEAVLLGLLPRCRNVTILEFDRMEIASLVSIAERLGGGSGSGSGSGNQNRRGNRTLPIFRGTSLRTLGIGVGPLLKASRTQTRERDAILWFLDVFRTVAVLGNDPRAEAWDDAVRYALLTNAAGRSLFGRTAPAPAHSSTNNNKHHVHNTNTTNDPHARAPVRAHARAPVRAPVHDSASAERTIPLGLWPRLIERASSQGWSEGRDAPASKVLYLIQICARVIAEKASERTANHNRNVVAASGTVQMGTQRTGIVHDERGTGTETETGTETVTVTGAGAGVEISSRDAKRIRLSQRAGEAKAAGH